MTDLIGKYIIVCVSGGIAAYRSLELIRLLKKAGANVRVMPTPNALEFVTALSFEAVSGQSVLTNALCVENGKITHIEEAERADAMVFAPATANSIAKMANGFADSLALQTLLSFRGPCIVAPAMESNMWEHEATKENVARLKARGALLVGPNSGPLASGRDGVGRMAEPSEIFDTIECALTPKDFAAIRVLLTAGPTIEEIDPVRFIANRSSGKMGVALTKALLYRGAHVILVQGPISIPFPKHCNLRLIPVRSAKDMLEQTVEHIDDAQLAILCAAVADFTPVNKSVQKIKKSQGLAQISLQPTTDILATIGAMQNKPFLVGFAAETENLIKEAQRKCIAKNCDLVCANEAKAMDADQNAVTIVNKSGVVSEIPRSSKVQVAHQILDVVRGRLSSLRAIEKP